MRALALPLVCLALVGCLQRTAVQRSPERMPVAVVYVVDFERDPVVRPMPEAVKAQVAEALHARNLEAREVPFETVRPTFEQVTDSARRFEAVRGAAAGAPLVLMVEARARFFSHIEGRWRWNVYGRVSAARAGSSDEPVVENLDVGAIVNFEHQKEDEVLSSVATAFGDAAGSAFDSFLKAAAAPKLSRAEQGAIYFVMVDRFDNADPSNDGAVDPKDPAAFHGGDLRGVLQRLDQLQALGVEAIWLSPVFAMRTEKFFGHGAFHGYWVEDLFKLEPRFGTEEDLRALSAELKKRNMRLYLDMVLNHVAPDAKLAREKPAWFHGKGPLEKWDDPEQVLTHDVMGLPDLKQEHEQVFQYLVDASLHWIRLARPDGFRLDAVKHVPSQFWSRYVAQVRAAAGPGFRFIGEMLDGDPEVVARAQREGGFDAMFDFPLYFSLIDVFCRDRAPVRLAATLSADRFYADPRSLVTLIDNHDLPRVATDCGGDLERVRQALTVQLTARGTPSLSYGTEAALEGAKEPLNRGPMVHDEKAQPLRAHIARLLALRKESPALQAGAPQVLVADDEAFAYLRVAADDAVLIAVNRGSKVRKLELPAQLQGAKWSAPLGGKGSAGEVPPKSVRVWRAAPQAKGALDAWARQLDAQWTRGAKRRPVEVVVKDAPRSAEVYWVGSGPELGGWSPSKAVGPIDAQGRSRALLPVGSVFEYKLLARAPGQAPAWESGENRALFVPDGEGPLKVKVAWRAEESTRR